MKTEHNVIDRNQLYIFIDDFRCDWVSGNEEMMTNDDNLESTSTLLN